MAQNRVTRLTSQPGLSSSQASQTTTIYTNAATAITPLQTAMRSYRSTIQTAVKRGATDTIDQTAERGDDGTDHGDSEQGRRGVLRDSDDVAAGHSECHSRRIWRSRAWRYWTWRAVTESASWQRRAVGGYPEWRAG
jgi:hypothetical protein